MLSQQPAFFEQASDTCSLHTIAWKYFQLANQSSDKIFISLDNICWSAFGLTSINLILLSLLSQLSSY